MKKTVITYSFLLIALMTSIIGKAQDKISIIPVSFNTLGREYSPVYYKNGLVFSGINKTNEVFTYLDEESGKQLTDLYYVPIIDDEFGKVELFSHELKSVFHEGPITFSKDGNIAYFTRSQSVKKALKNSTSNRNKLGVFKATFIGGKWSDVTPCCFNSKDYNVGQPSLSSDGKRLYVISDKNGGEGGMDLYYADVVDGVCGPLMNLGKVINTPANEMFPFIDANNKLYFSSNRTGGFGGLDIYESRFTNNSWNHPYIMDTSVNSALDDFGIVFNERETEGYFCSNRAGSDDIYKLKIGYPDFKDCQEIMDEQLCYEFFEKATIYVDSVSMIYEWDFGDGNKHRSLEAHHCYEKSGVYTVKLNVLDPFIGKTFLNEATYRLEIEPVIQPVVVCEDTVSILNNFNVQIGQGKWNEFLIDDYYIDYGDSVIEKNGKNGHQYQTIGLKELKFMISGYDKTSDEIKSKCFYKTIVVTSDKISQTTQNVNLQSLDYSNPNSDRLLDHEDGFYALEIISMSESALNNSAILKEYVDSVKETFDEKTGNYSYIVGKVHNPFELIEEFREAQKAGFSSSIVRSFESTNIKIEDLGIAYDIISGEVNIILHNIQFDFRGYLLDENSKIELKKLIQYLKDHAQINIEIGAHTDSKGSDSYNLELSQKRANSVISYIHSQGIEMFRLNAKGYGESQPIEPNTFPDGNDNPEGRAKNRRVVFKILNK